MEVGDVVNGIAVKVFIDLGSDCVTIHKSTASRLKLEISPHRQILKSFGEDSAVTTGRTLAKIGIDNIEIGAELLIVPNGMKKNKIMIGRNALDKPDIKIEKSYKKLVIKRVNNNDTSN